MKWHYDEPDGSLIARPGGLFILNEGNFQYSNSTLSYYTPEDGEVTNEAFIRANAMKLGDVAESMTIWGGRGWIVVNNSHVVFAIDPTNFREVGRIEDLTSPRYIHFVDERRAYVSQLWDNRIFIIDPVTYQVTGHIEVPGMAMASGSTEQMVQIGDYVYCCCWSYQNRVIKIDTATDMVTGSVTTPLQPRCMVADCYNKLWILTDGGYDGSPTGSERPTLCRIDPSTMEIELTLRFSRDDAVSSLITNCSGDKLYWINDDVWSMSVTATALPTEPLIEGRTRFFSLTVSPADGDIYVADALDYQQPGIIYRYTAGGEPISSFNAGINPGAFCWNIK